MIGPPVASAVVVASFAVFMAVAQLVRRRAVATRGSSIRRTRGVGDLATWFFWLPYVVVWLRPGPTLAPPPPVVGAGLALAVGGVGVALSWMRHPIYTGLAVHSLGACLATGNALFVAGTALVTFPIFVVRARARAEEALLGAALGAEYDRYAREVPMLVPGLRRTG